VVNAVDLERAETAILKKISERGDPTTATELVATLQSDFDEATVRQALWRLIDRSRVRLTERRQLVAA